MSTFQLVKKISAKTILGKRPTAPAEGSTEWLYEVIGIANGRKDGESDNGPWTALLGMFEARRMTDGARFRSGALFVPDVALDLVLGAMQQEGDAVETKDAKGRSTRRARSADSVEIGFRVGITYDADTPTQYVYVAEPLFAVSDADPLAALLGRTNNVVAIAPPEPKQAAKK